jgi:hypothetical protein
MIDYKYSFVNNNTEGDFYTLVMICWYINQDGERVNVKSDTQLNKTLTECFELAKAFVIVQ